jgi:hypothetical protein
LSGSANAPGALRPEILQWNTSLLSDPDQIAGLNPWRSERTGTMRVGEVHRPPHLNAPPSQCNQLDKSRNADQRIRSSREVGGDLQQHPAGAPDIET